MSLSPCDDAAVDGVEVGLVDQEGVVLRRDLSAVGRLREVDADGVVEAHRQKRPEFLGRRQSEDLGEVGRRFLAVPGRHDGVVEADGHANPVNHLAGSLPRVGRMSP